MFLFFAIFRLWEDQIQVIAQNCASGHRKMVAKHEARACAALNIAPVSRGTLLPGAFRTVACNDHPSLCSSRQIVLALSLSASSRSQSPALSASSHEFACQPSLSRGGRSLEISAFRRGGLASQCNRIISLHHTTKHEIKVYKSL